MLPVAKNVERYKMKESEKILKTLTKKRKTIKWKTFAFGIFKFSIAWLGVKKISIRFSIEWGWD